MRRNVLPLSMAFWFVPLFLLLASVSQADLTTPDQTQFVAPTLTNWGPNNPVNPVAPLQFSLFNPSLGTLTGVNIKLDYNFSSSVTLTIDDPLAPSSTLTMVVQGYMVLSRPQPDGQIHSIFSASESPSFQNVVQHTFNGVDTYSSIQNFTNSVTTQLTSNSDLALFTGPGTIGGSTIGLPIGASVPVTNFYSDTSQGKGVATTLASATVTLSYNYIPFTPIPEPSSLVLLGLTGTGMFWLVRRQRRRAIPPV